MGSAIPFAIPVIVITPPPDSPEKTTCEKPVQVRNVSCGRRLDAPIWSIASPPHIRAAAGYFVGSHSESLCPPSLPAEENDDTNIPGRSAHGIRATVKSVLCQGGKALRFALKAIGNKACSLLSPMLSPISKAISRPTDRPPGNGHRNVTPVMARSNADLPSMIYGYDTSVSDRGGADMVAKNKLALAVLRDDLAARHVNAPRPNAPRLRVPRRAAFPPAEQSRVMPFGITWTIPKRIAALPLEYEAPYPRGDVPDFSAKRDDAVSALKTYLEGRRTKPATGAMPTNAQAHASDKAPDIDFDPSTYGNGSLDIDRHPPVVTSEEDEAEYQALLAELLHIDIPEPEPMLAVRRYHESAGQADAEAQLDIIREFYQQFGTSEPTDDANAGITNEELGIDVDLEAEMTRPVAPAATHKHPSAQSNGQTRLVFRAPDIPMQWDKKTPTHRLI